MNWKDRVDKNRPYRPGDKVIFTDAHNMEGEDYRNGDIATLEEELHVVEFEQVWGLKEFTSNAYEKEFERLQ